MIATPLTEAEHFVSPATIRAIRESACQEYELLCGLFCADIDDPVALAWFDLK